MSLSTVLMDMNVNFKYGSHSKGCNKKIGSVPLGLDFVPSLFGKQQLYTYVLNYKLSSLITSFFFRREFLIT